MAVPVSQARRNVLYGLIGLSVAAIAAAVFVSRARIGEPRPGAAPAPAQQGPLVSPQPFFDFGVVSMAAGKVTHVFRVRNDGAAPVTIQKIYTSCMCTTATLVTRAGAKGPFGMPGHGAAAKLAERLDPGEEALVEAVFDPAAHGPSGAGWNERFVFVAADTGRTLELRFTANVTP